MQFTKMFPLLLLHNTSQILFRQRGPSVSIPPALNRGYAMRVLPPVERKNTYKDASVMHDWMLLR